MNRCLALIFAILCASLSVASACTAAQSDWVQFTLESRSNGQIHASFRDQDRRDNNHWSTNFTPAQLAGLDVGGFRAAGTRPLRFALVREAGRLDCSGNGGNSLARGNCGFTPNEGFNQLLASRGIGTPTRKESFGLVALDVRRELIDAVAAARYPTPDVDDLMALTYTTQVIKETMRIYPPMPVTIRRSLKDGMLGRYRIRKGDVILVGTLAAQRDPRYWGESPGEFDPEQFAMEKVVARPRHAFIPFSIGKRQCMAQEVTFMMLRVVLFEIYKRYLDEGDIRGWGDRYGVTLRAEHLGTAFLAVSGRFA